MRRFITLVDLAYESRTRIVCLSSVSLSKLFQNIVSCKSPPAVGLQGKLEAVSVRREGGSSSSMMSTFIGETEWSATGLPASLASGGAGETGREIRDRWGSVQIVRDGIEGLPIQRLNISFFDMPSQSRSNRRKVFLNVRFAADGITYRASCIPPA